MYRLRVEGGIDPVSGQRRRVTRTVKAKGERQAKDLLATLVAEVARQGPASPRSNLTVAEMLERWYDGFSQLAETGAKSVTTARVDREFLDAYILPHIGAIPLSKLSAFDLDRLYSHLLAGGGRKGRPLSPATVRKVHAMIRRALGQAVRWRWIDANPALNATPPSVSQHSLTPPDADQARQILAEAERLDPEWATYIRLAAAAGGRRGEMCALRWSDIDLDKGTLSVSRAIATTPAGVIVERQRPKSGRGFRQVALDERTVEALAAQLERQRVQAVGCRATLDANGFVFSGEPDGSKPWAPTVVTRRFIRLRKRLGLPVRLHDLRHYVATQLLAAGVDVRTVAGRLGQDPAVTLRTYAHFVPAKDRAAADVMGALLDG